MPYRIHGNSTGPASGRVFRPDLNRLAEPYFGRVQRYPDCILAGDGGSHSVAGGRPDLSWRLAGRLAAGITQLSDLEGCISHRKHGRPVIVRRVLLHSII